MAPVTVRSVGPDADAFALRCVEWANTGRGAAAVAASDHRKSRFLIGFPWTVDEVAFAFALTLRLAAAGAGTSGQPHCDGALVSQRVEYVGQDAASTRIGDLAGRVEAQGERVRGFGAVSTYDAKLQRLSRSNVAFESRDADRLAA